MLCIFFCLIPYCRFNVISLLSQNAINEGLPTPSTESQSRPIWGHSVLFCQICESSPYFLESCCASPHSRLCVLSHLIYKVSIEICMRAMMPALKIHSSREYIDSSVIELSLSFFWHGSHRSLSRLMYYQKHATTLTHRSSDTFPHSYQQSPFFYLDHSETTTLSKSAYNSY